MYVFLLLLIFICIAFYEIPQLIYQKQYKALISFAVLLAIGFVLNLLQILGIKLPNPLLGIQFLAKEIYKIMSH